MFSALAAIRREVEDRSGVMPLRPWRRTPGYREIPAYFKPRCEDMA